MDDELTLAVADLDEQAVLELVQERLDAEQDALLIFDACRQGMTLVGEYFQEGEYFISELIYSAAIFKRVAKMLEPHFSTTANVSRGAVVVGTVKGDIHDIGKDLVVVLLKAANFDVHDLGVDVPAHRFIETIQETGASVVGLSALLTTAFPPMKATVAAIEEAGLRSQVKIMVGGGPIDEKVQQFVGADAWGANAQTAVDLCNQWIGDAPNAQ